MAQAVEQLCERRHQHIMMCTETTRNNQSPTVETLWSVRRKRERELNFWLSENCRKVFFLSEKMSQNAKFEAENTLILGEMYGQNRGVI